MFKTIFTFEFKRWLKSWQFYLYLFIFFALGFFLMGSAVGFFDAVTVTTTSLIFRNSPLMINLLLQGITQLLYFLFPTIIGAAIYRDYKHETYRILYAYPFSKSSYLLGKFLSAFVITFIISVFIGIGLYAATIAPWANPELLGPNIFWNYAQSYVLGIIPNMLLVGAIVFVVTTLSRSVYTGFATVLALVIILGVVNGMASDMDNEILAALIDPSGSLAIEYYTKYWTISEYSTANLPVEKWFLINRAIWCGIAILFIASLFKLFSFSEHKFSFSFKKNKTGQRLTKSNFIGLYKIVLPKVNYNYSLATQWDKIKSFTKFDLKYLIKNKVFLILVVLGVISMLFAAGFANTFMGTKVLPVTRSTLGLLLETFEIFILVNTFLGAGLLVHRGKMARMDGLLDSTATPNWVFMASKFFALVGMQILLLLLVMVTGVLFQLYAGYTQLEIGLYLKSLLGISFWYYLIWAGLAMLVQVLFRNYIVGFFVLILFYLFGNEYGKLGVEQMIFFFNRLPRPSYSDLNGFGSGLPKYFIYVVYWLLFTGFIYMLSLLFWNRGVSSKIKERLYFAKRRATKSLLLPGLLCLAGFVALGSYLYYENTILHTYRSNKEGELLRVDYEQNFKQYENLNLPRIVDVKVDMDLYPKSRDFEANGMYLLENKNSRPVDTLLVSYDENFLNEIEVEGAQLVRKDTVYGFAFYKFEQALDSGSTAKLNFTVKNKPNTWLRNNSPVLYNGTFINNFIFPSLGYAADQEISDTQLRKKYNLPPKERMAEQTDRKARQNTYIRSDSDWITFETTVSTDKDQIAIAPGYLQKEWVEGDRRYFHYSMGEQKILNFFAYNSGAYEVERDQWEDIDIEVYYNKAHPYNIDRMVNGLKQGFDYFTEAYSPFQFKQARIIEFPSTEGSFAQSFANTIPFSEGMGFIADVDDEDEDGVDFPYAVTAHELAHQWWAHQVIGANVQGSTMLSESLSEYSSLKVLEHRYGKDQMRKFLKEALHSYLTSRSFESKKEKPLMYNENQSYIHYYKGSMVFYALSDYMGEKEMNKVLSNYIDKVAFQEPPYTTAGELVADLKKAIPDSLSYLITDMFETITLYDNLIEKADFKELDNGKYEVSIKAIASKYRTDEKGERIYANAQGDSLVATSEREKELKSYPLNDYIEIGIFGKESEEGKKDPKVKELYLKKHKITDIINDYKIIVDEKPFEVGIDPYNKLIDARSYDNRKKISPQKAK